MNKRVDELMSKAVKIIDDEKRRKYYHEIEKIVIDEAPWVFFWHKSSCSINQPWVKGFNASPLAVMEKWNTLYLTEKLS
jgi:ABC-type transport system substrate-binding protein